MLKKLLIAIGILAVVGVAGFLYIGNKIDSAIKAHEPEFRQYVTMTTEEQNAYVRDHFNEFFSLLANINDKDEQLKAAVEQIKSDPEALEAGIALGRSFVAGLILANEDILKDLSADIHDKLKVEADESDNRAEKFKVFMNKYFPNDK